MSESHSMPIPLSKMTSRVFSVLWFKGAINLRVRGFTQARSLVRSHFLMDSEQMERAQRIKARNIICYASANVPYYKKLVTSHIPDQPDEFWQFWRSLPIVSRQIMKNESGMLIAPERVDDRHYLNQTSGSTGHPMQFRQCSHFFRHQVAGNLVASQMTGYEFGDSEWYMCSSQYNPSSPLTLLERAEIWMTRRKYFDLSIASSDRVAEVVAKIHERKPEIVLGYPSVLVALAMVAADWKIPLKVKSVECFGEPLGRHQRSIIQESFGAKVYDKYGAREVGTIAHECSEHRGMHVFTFNVLVEIVNARGEVVPTGEIGRIVLTSFHNHAMPFIRYDIGDYGRLLPNHCTCGFETPILDSIRGRESDVIVLADGTMLFPDFFYDLFSVVKGIEKYTVVQETSAELLVYIVPRPEFSRTSFRYLEAVLRNETRGRLRPTFFLCDNIPPLNSGKHRYVISSIAGVKNN